MKSRNRVHNAVDDVASNGMCRYTTGNVAEAPPCTPPLRTGSGSYQPNWHLPPGTKFNKPSHVICQKKQGRYPISGVYMVQY